MSKRAFVLVAVALMAFALEARASRVDVKLTATGLGFTTDDGVRINWLGDRNPVEADRAGLVTSTIISEGSILTILEDATAGTATITHKTLVTLTSNSRIDNFPVGTDWQSGIFALSKQEGNSAKHKDRNEGLGVRAFTVNLATNLRQIDATTSRANIEGSKEVSGGVDIKHNSSSSSSSSSSDDDDDDDDDNGDNGGTFVPGNGPDHVDEIVFFDFNDTEFNVDADSFVVRFTKFKPNDDFITVTLTLTDNAIITLTGIDASDLTLFSDQGDDVWDLNFGGIASLDDTDLLKSVSIRAIEKPDDSKSHFLINGVTLNTTPVPEPATLMLMGLGGLIALPRRRHS